MAPTTTARELDLWAENDRDLYNQYCSIIRNLQRKINAGKYDPALAPKLWRYWYDAAARNYCKACGGTVRSIFPVAVRQECAEARAIEEYAKIMGGEYGWL